MIDLFYFVSPNARKIHMALEELDLPYAVRWVDITTGDQFAPQFLQVNPNGKIPAIVDHDGPGGAPVALFESAAILLYLAEKTGALLPDDPVARWEAICWTVWQVANQGPGLGQATHFLKYAPDGGHTDPYAQDRFRAEAGRVYRVLDERLAGREYLAGDMFSIADIACFPWTRLHRNHGVDVAEYPHVAAWSERIATRPSARAKIEDRRDEATKRFEYSAAQRAVLFPTAPEARS
ncbi:glutathione S-transferase family protein [Actinomycetospora aeridis]|uniref:Glutathione S-transferase N-terminal domain-containing protein n=1 Tax=Actinomycetospora aeridis TaxID=3129231 RepID=A0ABU8NFX3_9PSEU